MAGRLSENTDLIIGMRFTFTHWVWFQVCPAFSSSPLESMGIYIKSIVKDRLSLPNNINFVMIYQNIEDNNKNSAIII